MWQFLVQKDDGKKGSTLTAKKKKKLAGFTRCGHLE